MHVALLLAISPIAALDLKAVQWSH